MNITLALFIYLCIYMNINYYITSRISADTDASVLNTYSLNIGETIYKINGSRIYNDEDIARIVQNAKSDSFDMEIITPNNEHEIRKIDIPKKEIGYAGIVFEGSNVYAVQEDAVAYKAGLKAGDEVISVNDISSENINAVLNEIKANPNKEIVIAIKRNGEAIDIKIVPESIYRRELNLKYVILKDMDFIHNLAYAWNETKFYLRANFIGIAELISGNTENVEFQGIVGISNQISKTESFIEFFYLMSAISMSLGIMNLLPIPGLDGGKILITLIELVRRKPISKETEAKITMIGFAVLMFLMIYVTFSDISKLFT